MSDWADTEDHDYLNGLVGHRINEVTTGNDGEGSWLRLALTGDRVFEVRGVPEWGEGGGLEVRDAE